MPEDVITSEVLAFEWGLKDGRAGLQKNISGVTLLLSGLLDDDRLRRILMSYDMGYNKGRLRMCEDD